MTPRQFNRLLVAPEIIVIDLADAALTALERALRLEHPLVDAPPPAEHPPIRRRARAVLRRAQRLHHSLRRYRALVHDILRQAEQNDLPF
jgi:hypothetical protein